MEPPYPSYVPIWHNNTYEAISPKRPELSAAGKSVVVAGGGSGIGRAIAEAFAQAGASHVAILGRRVPALEDTKQLIVKKNPAVNVTVHGVDITNEQGLKAAASNVGTWDILVISSGVHQDPGHALDVQPEDWWRVMEINVKGTLLTARTFYPTHKPDAAIIGVSSTVFTYPASFLKGVSAYVVSKGAQAKLLEMLAVEYSDIYVGILHPGVVETEGYKKLGMKGGPFDAVELSGHFVVWMASKEASFTRGKFLFANWDVDELRSKATQLENSAELTYHLNGMPSF